MLVLKIAASCSDKQEHQIQTLGKKKNKLYLVLSQRQQEKKDRKKKDLGLFHRIKLWLKQQQHTDERFKGDELNIRRQTNGWMLFTQHKTEDDDSGPPLPIQL